MTLIYLPNELLLHIANFLQLRDVVGLRQTCRRLLEVTQDRALWLGFLHHQQSNLPLHVSSEDDLLSRAIESRVKSAHLIAHSWTKRRKLPPLKLTPDPAGTMVGLQIFLDRWLLCIYADGHVHLCDINPRNHDAEGAIVLCATQAGMGQIASFAASLDTSKRHMFLAISSASPPWQTYIYRVELRNRTSSGGFTLLHTLPNAAAELVRAIETQSEQIVMSSSYTAHIYCYSTGRGPSLESRLTATIETENVDEVWNGVTGARFMGPYLVVLKLWSMEFHPFEARCNHLPNQSQCRPPGLPVLKHHFLSGTFRQYSFSDHHLVHDIQGHPESLNFTFFGNDAIQGIFRYNFRINFLQLSAGSRDLFTASLDVTRAAVYPLSASINSMFSPLSLSSGTPSSGPPPPSPVGLSEQVLRSRGFVSAIALGPQGKRAVWVERKRASTLREVLVWQKKRLSGREGDDESDVETGGHIVYDVRSYDLRDDITHCALAEVSGRIVLGNRIGEVLLLNPGVAYL